MKRLISLLLCAVLLLQPMGVLSEEVATPAEPTSASLSTQTQTDDTASAALEGDALVQSGPAEDESDAVDADALPEEGEELTEESGEAAAEQDDATAPTEETAQPEGGEELTEESGEAAAEAAEQGDATAPTEETAQPEGSEELTEESGETAAEQGDATAPTEETAQPEGGEELTEESGEAAAEAAEQGDATAPAEESAQSEGSENACEHAHPEVMTRPRNQTYTPVDNKYHLMSYDLYGATVCPDCGETLVEETLIEAGIQERMEHSYGNDVCRMCGHQNEGCTHERVREETFWTNKKVTSKDATSHTFVASVMKKNTCLDCNTVWTELVEEGVEAKEPHDFMGWADTSHCSVCGYEGPGVTCQHEQTAEDIYYRCTEILSQTATHHKMKAVKEVVTYCTACQQVLDDKTISDQIVEEEHAFELGKCKVCDYATTCQHEQTSETNDYMRTTLVSVTETGHTMTGDCWKVVTCDVCGDTVSRTFQGYGQTFTADHEFDDKGICTVCRYEKPCDHPNAAVAESWESFKGYAPKDGKTHVEIYEVFEQKKCPDCEAELPEEKVGEREGEAFEHHYTDGVCVDCGGVCEHADTESHEQSNNFRCEPKDMRTHILLEDVYQVTRCLDCGMEISSELLEKDRQIEGSHFYDGGTICVNCGYENVCTHENKESQDYYENYALVAQDNMTHVETYDIRRVETCTDCGIQVSSQIIEQNHTETARHIYDENEKCVSCGHQNTCDHANATVDSWDSYMGCVSKDSKYHVESYELLEQKECPDCAMIFPVEKTGEREGDLREHYFFDGVCVGCGYENTCKHAHPEASTRIRNQAYTPVDNKYHLMSYDLYEATVCADCGETLVEEKLIETGVQERMEHNYDPYNNLCHMCGHQNEGCTHERVMEETFWTNKRVTSKDEACHTFVASVMKRTTCLDCATVWTETVREGVEAKEPHDFMGWSDTTHCSVCGYEGPGVNCQHENTAEDVYYRCTEVLSQTATHHKMNAVKEIVTYCTACQKVLGDKTISNQIVEEEHQFELGKCWVCGYANPCQHGKTSEWYDYMRTALVSVTETGHTMTGDCWKVVGCEICGDTISRTFQGYDQTFTADHEFDDEGVCVACHYKAVAKPTDPPVVTPDKTPGKTPAPANTPEPDNTFTPTARPAVTAEPTPEPTAEPTAAPMVDTLLTAVREAEAEGSEVKIEVVGAEEIMTETEYTALKALPAQEQILVTLASIGFEDVVEAATKTLNVELSDGAKTLVTQVTERMAAVTQEEKAIVEEKLAKYFPVEEVVIDGVKTSYFVIDLRIEVDGVVRVERYGFRLDENGEWIFVKLDLQSVQW